MLSAIREKTQGIIAGFILMLVIIPFALWGVNSYFDTGSTINVAKVGDIEISQVSYRRALDRMRGRVEPNVLDTPQFKQMILDELIDQSLLAQDVLNQKYRISDAYLAEMIQEIPAFQRDGQFDSAMYEATLRREGLSTGEFEARLRENALANQIQLGLSASGIVTKTDMAEILRLMTQEREVAYAVIDAEKLQSRIPVSEKEMESYYNAHPEMFQIPEQVRVEYLRLSAKDLNQNYQPTTEEIKRAYDAEAGRFVTPGKRRASHILISIPDNATAEQAEKALARIQDIARQVQSGSTFATLAKKYSADTATAASGGDLGEVRRGVLPRELEEAVFTLKQGEISQPVHSSYGYHLVKLTGLTPEKRIPLAKVQQELVESIQRRKGEDKFFDMVDKFRNLVYEQPDSLAPAAEALGLKVHKSGWFTRSGGPGIAEDPTVVEAAFEPSVLSQSRNSDAFELGADTMMAVRVVEHRPTGRKSLNQVRAQIERSLRLEKGLQMALKMGESTLDALHAGESLKSLAAKRGFKYQQPKNMKRQPATRVESSIAEAAFRAAPPESGKAVYDLISLGDKGYAVMAVTRVEQPVSNATMVRETAQATLAKRRGPDYFVNYRAGLRKNAKIKIFSSQL